MIYAVILINGNQYKVSEGDELLLEGTRGGEEIKLKEVLLLVDEKKVLVGTPTVKGAKVTAEVLGREKGKKLRVSRYKAKSRYRRTRGHRTLYTRLKIQKITASK